MAHGEKALEIYHETPNLGKNVITVGVVGLSIWSVFKISAAARNAREKKPLKKESSQQASETVEKDLTYPKSQYTLWANQLEKYMFDLGTNKSGVISIFEKIKTNSDFTALNVAFGQRIYYYFGMNMGYMNLGQWLEEEDSYFENLIYDINEKLKANHIKYSY